MQGKFITFEGVDGCGKSTQLCLAEAYLREKGCDVLLTREPGGPAISEQIRAMLLDPENRAICDEAEALLYAAARVQHLHETILPALAAGKVVLCDRFLDSSLAYQGYGRELGEGYVLSINAFAAAHQPDLTIYLRYAPEAARARIASRPADRLEQQGDPFFARVHAGYERIAVQNPARVAAIDAGDTVEAIQKQIAVRLDALLAR